MLAALLAGCVTVSSTRTGPAASGRTEPAITAADLRTRLEALSHDSMMGRESGDLGAFKATAYVAAEFQRLGLEPAGDNGTWFQVVPLYWAMVDPTSRITASGTTLRPGVDFLPNTFAAEPKDLDGVEVVLGGTGDTTTWISPADAAGKLVVIDPLGAPCCGGLNAPHWRGAVAVAGIGLEAVAPEAVGRQATGRPVRDTTRTPGVVATLLITRRAAAALLGADPAGLRPGARGARVAGHYDITRKPVPYPARNVVGILRGTDPALRNEYVSLTAHHDHVGYDHLPVDHDSTRAYQQVVRPMGADSRYRPPTAEESLRIRAILDTLRRQHPARLDSIRNGADDDGSGTVSILEVAEALAQPGARPRRSILFVSHTAEEAGLLGSAWYTAHATVPVDSIVAEIDQDMVGRGKPTDMPRGGGTVAADAQYLEVIGARRLSTEFGDTIEAVNARQPLPFRFDYTYDAPGHPLRYYCRADHYNYAKYGIPAMAISRGEHLDYHQVTDEAQYIDYPDLARVSKMVFDAARAIGNMAHRPALSVPKPTDPNAICRQ